MGVRREAATITHRLEELNLTFLALSRKTLSIFFPLAVPPMDGLFPPFPPCDAFEGCLGGCHCKFVYAVQRNCCQTQTKGTSKCGWRQLVRRGSDQENDRRLEAMHPIASILHRSAQRRLSRSPFLANAAHATAIQGVLSTHRHCGHQWSSSSGASDSGTHLSARMAWSLDTAGDHVLFSRFVTERRAKGLSWLLGGAVLQSTVCR